MNCYKSLFGEKSSDTDMACTKFDVREEDFRPLRPHKPLSFDFKNQPIATLFCKGYSLLVVVLSRDFSEYSK